MQKAEAYFGGASEQLSAAARLGLNFLDHVSEYLLFCGSSRSGQNAETTAKGRQQPNAINTANV